MENQFTSENYFDLIIPNIGLQNLEKDFVVTRVNNKHSITHIPYEKVNKCQYEGINYTYLPSCYTLESTFALEETGVKRVQNNPNFALYGTGVLLGIIDSGINYLHPAFLFNDKTTRIHSIWDQTINNDNSKEFDPEFPYGTMYSKQDINKALQQSNPLELVPTDDIIGHGTAIAGIAGGTADNANYFSGVAILSEFVVVKLKQAKKNSKDFLSIAEDKICYQESDLMMAVKYLEYVSRQLNRPLAICCALGSNQGSHDGLGALSTYLNNLSELPRTCSVICAGNEGNARRHFSGIVRSEEEITEFEIFVGENDKKFFVEIWTQPILRMSLEIISPSGEKITDLNPGFGQVSEHTFIFGPSIVCVNNITTEPESGEQLIWIRFENAQSGLWRFRNYNIDKINARFNAWLPSGDIISKETNFIVSDPNTTITSPANGVASLAITSYDTLTGGISIFSSKGYTRVNEIKPDLAAPGTEITAPSNKNGYVNVSGTGAAAAMATGIVALLLEWAITRGYYTNITGVEVKTFLIRGARRELNIEYPNRTWGYGKIDLYGVFEKLII